jgi:hypothetical protein
MTKPFKLVSMTAVVCAAALTITPETFAGTRAIFRTFDTGSARVNVTSPANNNNAGARANRHGADDPANHDINDDRGGANQPNDDRGRHRRGRGRGR